MALRIRFQYPTGSRLGYSIERLSDERLYDFSNSTFVPSPKTPISSLPEDTGIFIGRFRATFLTTPSSQFSDGDYVVTVHDQAHSNAVVAELAATIHSGDDATAFPAATAYTLSGPTSGPVNSASTNFIVAPNGTVNGTLQVTITPSGGGLSTPIVKTFTDSTPQAFTITPKASGMVTLTGTNGAGLANSSPLSYLASSADELSVYYPATGSTVYFVVTQPGNKAWNASAFVTGVAADQPSYAIAATDAGGRRIYEATFPAAIPAGSVVTVFAYEQVGGSPSSTDLLIGLQGPVIWNGMLLAQPSDLASSTV